MSNFSALKTAIQNAIKQNGNEEITGNLLQGILLSIVETLGDSAINTLETNLSNEASTRGNADTQLNNLITGVKNNVDNGYVYAGIATPSTTPVSGKVFYIALQAGTYTNFGGTTVTEGITILKYNGTSWVKEQVLFTDGGVFDISAYHATGGTLAKYADLTAALGTSGANIPEAIRKGGMSVKYVQTDDNKYVQYRLKVTSFSTNEEDWQCEDAIDVIRGEKDKVSIVDKNNYAILKLLSYLLVDKNGNIITKGFNSTEQAIIGNALAVLSEKFANTFPGGTPSNFSVEDENHNAILKLLSYFFINEQGDIQTKSFDSSKIRIVKNSQDSLSFEDLAGNAVLKVGANGHVKTKSFDSSKFIIVDINGGGDYTSLEDAINNAGDSYLQGIDRTIIVMPGTYQMTQVANDSTATSFGNRSLNIIGIDREKCIIIGDNGYYTNSSQEGSPGFRDSAPLKLAGNCYVANLTIISTDDNFQMDPEDTGDPTKKHHAYCIHIDYYNQGRWTFHLDNCILKNDHYACIGVGLRGKLVVTNCIMECAMYDPDPLYIRGCVYAHDSGQAGVPGPYDEVEVLVKDCILTGNSGAPLTFYTNLDKTMYLTFINNVVFNEQGGSALVMDEGREGGHLYKTKYCFGNNNSELNYNV